MFKDTNRKTWRSERFWVNNGPSERISSAHLLCVETGEKRDFNWWACQYYRGSRWVYQVDGRVFEEELLQQVVEPTQKTEKEIQIADSTTKETKEIQIADSTTKETKEIQIVDSTTKKKKEIQDVNSISETIEIQDVDSTSKIAKEIQIVDSISETIRETQPLKKLRIMPIRSCNQGKTGIRKNISKNVYKKK